MHHADGVELYVRDQIHELQFLLNVIEHQSLGYRFWNLYAIFDYSIICFHRKIRLNSNSH